MKYIKKKILVLHTNVYPNYNILIVAHKNTDVTVNTQQKYKKPSYLKT